MAINPPVHHNSEVLRGELTYRAERLRRNAPSVFGYVWPLVLLPFQALWWLAGLAIQRTTGMQLLGARRPLSTSANSAAATCKGSGRPVKGGPLARCTQCGKYVGINSAGRLASHPIR